MNVRPRLIERAFPLKQASLDSLHERQVRLYKVRLFEDEPEKSQVRRCRNATAND